MKLKAPAKINFGLWIGEKRQDTYHPVSTVYLPVSLYDTLSVEIDQTDKIRLECSDRALPIGEKNLCWKAAELFRQETGANVGICIRLNKNIPAGAGLGGGSSDAAAVLMALNRQIFGEMTDERLFSIAVRIGADVPFFLYRRPCSATGIGEKLKPIKFPWDPFVVIIDPGYGVNTAEAYAAFDSENRDTGPEPDFNCLLNDLKDFKEAKTIFGNDFEPVIFRKTPELEKIKQDFYDAGAFYASLSGSGSAIFGFFETESSAENLRKYFQSSYKTHLTRIIREIPGESLILS